MSPCAKLITMKNPFCSIDATRESGRLGRLVNHSRQHPNLQTKVVMVKGEEQKPRLILVAKTEVSNTF